jgi:hypothetical protein
VVGCFEHGKKKLAISTKCGNLAEKLRKILQDSVSRSYLIHFSEYTALFFFVCLDVLTKEWI